MHSVWRDMCRELSTWLLLSVPIPYTYPDTYSYTYPHSYSTTR